MFFSLFSHFAPTRIKAAAERSLLLSTCCVSRTYRAETLMSMGSCYCAWLLQKRPMREAAVKQRQMMDGVKHELFESEPASPSHARSSLASPSVEKKHKRQQPASASMPAPQVAVECAVEAKKRKVHARLHQLVLNVIPSHNVGWKMFLPNRSQIQSL
jgi:hypothetical protein